MQTIEHFERLLTMWEDLHFMLRIRSKIDAAAGRPSAIPFAGQIRHSAEFRNYLLGLRSPHVFEHERFMCEEADVANVGMMLKHCPLMLYSWTAGSRRVFRPDQDLQLLLQSTSLARLKFEDVPWPFQSYAVALERPLYGEDGRPHSLVMISIMHDERTSSPSYLALTLLNDDLLGYQPLSKHQKERLANKLERKNLRSCHSAVARCMSEWSDQVDAMNLGYHVYFPWETIAGLEIDAAFDEVPNFAAVDELEDCAMLVNALRIAVGIGLYLESIPVAQRAEHVWKPSIEAGHPGRAITSQAEVCDVASVHRLSAEERAAFDQGGVARSTGQVSSHFRRGHWRKKPGQGSDPDAPKTVWVRPTLVKPQALPESGLPVGSAMRLSS